MAKNKATVLKRAIYSSTFVMRALPLSPKADTRSPKEAVPLKEGAPHVLVPVSKEYFTTKSAVFQGNSAFFACLLYDNLLTIFCRRRARSCTSCIVMSPF